MDRKGRYLQPGTKATAPNTLFAVVMSPSIDDTSSAGYWESWGGADVCVSHYRRGRWSAVKGARAETPEQLYTWMETHCDRSARNYVVAPDCTSALAVGRFWDHLCTGPVKRASKDFNPSPALLSRFPQNTSWVRRCTLAPKTCIFDYQRNRVRWVWVNGYQHFNMSEAELARAVGEVWDDTGEADPPSAHTGHTTRARALLWLHAYQKLSDWWRATAKAPFGLTAASCAIGILRTHVPERYLCTHSNPAAHELERQASYGGMQRVWFYGDIGNPREHSTVRAPAPTKSPYGSIPGPLVQLDVRSMYPWLLRERRFPCKIADVYYRMAPTDLLALCRSFGVIARVTVETEVPEYPLRVGDHIIYPVGRFTTALTGPELLRIASEGRIAHVHYVVTYLLGRPFQAAAGALIAMREGARAGCNPEWELFAKNVGNSLAGKLAQRQGEWAELDDYPAQVPFGEWTDTSARGKRRRRFRSIAGLVWEWKPDEHGAGPYTAAFAYLTAYGRLHMRGIRDGAAARSVVSMDTDGLWVVADALASFQFEREAHTARAGSLCVKCRIAAARFLDAKHYFTPDGWVLGGFASPVVRRWARAVEDVQRYTAIGARGGAPPRGTAVKCRTSALALAGRGVSVGPDGWALPTRKRGNL